MDPTSITVAIPVSDLATARDWYDRVLDRHAALEPVPGLVEYEFGGTWVQLVSGRVGSPGWVLRYGVASIDALLSSAPDQCVFLTPGRTVRDAPRSTYLAALMIEIQQWGR